MQKPMTFEEWSKIGNDFCDKTFADKKCFAVKCEDCEHCVDEKTAFKKTNTLTYLSYYPV